MDGGGEINFEKCPTFLPMCVVRPTFGAALGPHRILQLFSVVCCLESLFLFSFFYSKATREREPGYDVGALRRHPNIMLAH